MDEKAVGTKMVWWRRRWFKVTAGIVVVGVVAVGVAAEYVVRHAGPIVRQRVIETLSARFQAPVELDRLDISLLRGIKVEGGGLRIPYGADGSAIVSVDRFSFHTTVKGLLHQPTHIGLIEVDGMELHIPPGSMHGEMRGPADPAHPKTKAKIAFTAGKILCTHVKLVIETNKPGKEPLVFDMGRVELNDFGPDRPMAYDAALINPKPVGAIHAVGHFGPWDVDDPRSTPLNGSYDFTNADLSTIKGIGGTLSSTGKFEGELQRLTVDGTTDTPDFWIDTSHHPVPLRTVFHAYVDATSGDTMLDPVQARVLHTDFTCRGTVTKVPHQGHDIALDVQMPNGRIEDMLTLGVKTQPPLMRGGLTLQAKLHIPPGQERVAQKIELAGTFGIKNVALGNAKWQDKVDGLSMRAQGRPEDAKAAGSDGTQQVSSQMSAKFNLAHGVILVDDLKYQIPGALVAMNGVYSTDGELFEFRGHVRTDATASKMVTGWKSILLMPVDKFLKKNGAGMQLPISVSGTQGDIHFGLAMGGNADETAAQIAQEMRMKAAVKADAKAEDRRK